MPNPTIGPPSGAFAEWLNTGGTVGELMQAAICPLVGGPLRDVVGNAIAIPFVGASLAGLAHPSGVQAGLFDAGGITAPALRIRHRDPAYYIPGRGLATTAVPRTFFAVFKPRAGALPAARLTHVFGCNETNATTGICYNTTTAGVIQLVECFGANQAATGVTLTTDKWYAVAITYNSGTSRVVQVYNLTDQAYVTTEATGATYTGLNPSHGVVSISINAFCTGNFDLAAACLYNGTMDPATNSHFATLVADPWAAMRGTYSGGGTMTGTSMVAYDQTTTTVYFHANRPASGTPAGYQYRLHRSTTTPNFTPSGGTALGSLQSSPLLSDATLAVGIEGYYKLEQTDGTTTTYTAEPLVARRSKGDFDFLLIGDSRGGWGPAFAQILFGAGYRVREVSMNLGGSSVYNPTASTSWQPNTTQDPTNGQASTVLLANALAEADRAGVSTANLMFDLGTNDVGQSTSLASYQTYIGRVWAQLTGFARMFITGPFTRSGGAYMALTKSYNDWLATQANGTTRYYTSRVVDAVATYGLDMLSGDGLHLISGFQVPGHQSSRYVLSVLEPAAYASAGDVRSGVDRGDGTTGTLVVPSLANTKIGVAGDGGTGTYDGSDRWSDPGVANVLAATAYKANSATNNRTGTATVPAASLVLSGTSYGVGGNGSTGTRTDAPAGKVRSGTSYGAGGTALSGTLTLPTAGQVLAGVQYGEGGNQYTGTLDAGAGGVYPDPGDVRLGVSYGSSQTGTLTLPTAGQVLSGVGFGSGGTQYTGTRADAPVGKVVSGTSYGAGGTGLAGTVILPAESDVRDGEGYGAGGTEFVGTLVVTGGGGATADEVVDELLGRVGAIESGKTFRETLRTIVASAGGPTAKNPNGSFAFKDRDTGATNFTFTPNGDGSRTVS